MKVEVICISLLVAGQAVSFGAPSSAAAAPAAPFRPVVPAPAQQPVNPSVVPAQPNRLAPAGPQNGEQNPAPNIIGTNPVVPVPRNPVATNGLVPMRGQPGGTNREIPEFPRTNMFQPPTNQFGPYSNRFGPYTNRFGGFTNRFGSYTNEFGGYTNRFFRTNRFGYPFTNQFTTNTVIRDEGTTPQDRALLSQIRQELLPEIRESGAPVHLVSVNGVVTMTGFVTSPEESQEFARIVQQTPGVTGVNNQLQVSPWMPTQRIGGEERALSATDRELLERVRHHLYGGRDFDRDDRGRGGGEGEMFPRVHIAVQNGVVTLTGFVSSQTEEQTLVANVQSTPGVVRVDNDLQVRAVGGASSPSGTSTGDASGVPFPGYVQPNPSYGGGTNGTNSPR